MPWKWNAEIEGQDKSSLLFKKKWDIKILFIKEWEINFLIFKQKLR